MTMFSQKPPFDLAKFLSEPASTQSRKYAASDRHRKASIAATTNVGDYDDAPKKKTKAK